MKDQIKKQQIMKIVHAYPIILLALLTMISCSKKEQVSNKKYILKEWSVQNSQLIEVDGNKISTSGFDVQNWYSADVPETILHTLVKSGVYKDIYLNDNLERIPKEQFNNPWWYRTEFDLEKESAGILLKLNGINYKANVWLNGKLIADSSKVKNSFRQFKFNIKKHVKTGKNTLAIEVIPPKAGDFTIGFVDWAPTPPDKNMGIFRPVLIEENGGIALSDPFVSSTLNNDLSEATLQASTVVENNTDQEQTGSVTLSFDNIKLDQKLTLKAGEKKKIVFNVIDFPDLLVKNPKLWWPHTLGDPYLHNAEFKFKTKNNISDKKEFRFGIRTLSKYLTDEGALGFKINGKKILIQGAGWMDKLMLEDTKESLEAELSYAKDIGLNAIRLEGFWGKGQTMYDLCDEKGIMMMIGITCQWEWSYYLGMPTDKKYGGIVSEENMKMMSSAFRDQIIWLRNHPAIYSWVGGSDLEPKPELEKMYFDIFKEYDSTRVYLASAKKATTMDGPTGVKMEGPYAYVPPVYWYSDTKKGGAYGFNTETGPGIQLPPLQSLKKMFSEEHLWPIDTMWNYHCGRYEFGDLRRFTKAMDKRYGKAKDLKDYVKKGQLLNYELMRPMFEAFSAYRYKATGVNLWMLNSPWPEMYWQLFDYYLMPNAAYFGAKVAMRPYHIIYDYHRRSIFAVNDRLEDKNGCTLKLRVYNINSQLKFGKEIALSLKANSSDEILSLAELNIPSVYFIDTRLYDNSGKEIDNNFYWISPKDDILDYEDTSEAWYVTTPSKQYANFTALNNMAKVKVENNITIKKGDTKTSFEVLLENKSNKIAFFIHLAINDKITGETIAPVIWSDNYISLLPGETRVLKASINNSNLEGKNTVLATNGYNLHH